MDESRKATQCERILRFLRAHGTITQLEAMNVLGVFRLASRISDLKKQGYAIKGEMVASRNRYGEKIHFKQYSIIGEE